MNPTIGFNIPREHPSGLRYVTSLIYMILFVLLSNLAPVHADIIFPARIELKEKTTGEFDVLFTLPLINNKKLKADLELPSVFREISEHEISTSYSSYFETWRVACTPEQLFGESIVIKGLRGTYIEIMLLIEMLDGRTYRTTLKPSHASFTIPEPPSIVNLLIKSSHAGMHRIAVQPIFYLLLFVLVFFISQRRTLLLGFVAFVTAHMISQYLGQAQLLKLSPHLPHFIILFVILFPAFDLVQGKPAIRRWFQNLWLLALILGVLTGGSRPDTPSLPGLSYSEKYIVLLGTNLGITIGLVLVYFLIREVKELLTMFILRTQPQRAHMILGYLVGVPASALLIYYSTTFLITTTILPALSVEYFIFPLLFGYWFWQKSSLTSVSAIGLFMLFTSIGLVVGGSGYSIPLGSTLLFSGILFFCTQILFDWRFSESINHAIASIAVLSYGWTVSQTILQNLTLPIANTVGNTSLALFLFYMGYSFLTVKPADGNTRFIKILTGIAAGIILLLRVYEYKLLFDREISINMAMGQLTIPVLSLILFVGTLIVWPRTRKIHQYLDIKSKKPIRHWAIIGLSFLVLPYVHVRVTNPLFETHAPQGDGARLILQNILSNTYRAFNLKDEDELYQALAANVSGDLVTNIYLDSRRRLTAGIRQGGKVLVRDVSVLEVGDLLEGANPDEGFSYESKWTVTARVKHLQHIHYRKNIYSGILKIKLVDNKWKIANLQLKSEDRVIVQGSPG